MAYDLWNFRKPLDRSLLRELRPRQAEAIDAIRQAVIDGHKRIICQAPTGFGKTVVAAHLIAGALEKNNRAMFVCPAINLVTQTLAAFEREGIHDIGVMQAQHERTDCEARVQIASVQTLVRRRMPQVDFVIIDEAHTTHDALNLILDSEEWGAKIVIGFSATPWARGMGLRWSKLIVAAKTRELIGEGWLSQFSGYGPGVDADLSGVRTTAGDFNEGDLSTAMQKSDLVADVVQTWIRRADGRQTFLFAVDRAHAATLQVQFQAAGINCGYIDGNSTPDERTKTFRRYRLGQDKIIASVGCLTTGIDEDVRCIVMARPTKSEMLWVQMIGRGLRTAEGKDHLLILDHAGNCERLGFPDAIHHESLDTRRPLDKGGINPEDDSVETVSKPRKCGECGFLIPPKARECPKCGALAKISTVQVADGELVKFGEVAKTKPKRAIEKIAAFGKQEIYSMLLTHADQRHYKNGWVANKYREIFGVWPRGLSAEFKPLRPELFLWLTSEQIRYAKSKRARVAYATGKGFNAA